MINSSQLKYNIYSGDGDILTRGDTDWARRRNILNTPTGLFFFSEHSFENHTCIDAQSFNSKLKGGKNEYINKGNIVN